MNDHDPVNHPAHYTPGPSGVVERFARVDGELVPHPRGAWVQAWAYDREHEAREKAEALINSSENPYVIRASELGYALARYEDAVNAQPWASDLPIRVLLDGVTHRLNVAEARVRELEAELAHKDEALAELEQCKAERDEHLTRAASLVWMLPPATLAGCVQKWRDEYAAERSTIKVLRKEVEFQAARAERAEAELARKDEALAEDKKTLEFVAGDCRSLAAKLDASLARVRELEQEVETLRWYGNKDCTAQADAALAEKRAAAIAKSAASTTPRRNVITLTVEQILCIAKFYADSDEEHDSEKDLIQMGEWTDVESGEKQPAGVYVGDSEYPEHGLMGPFPLAKPAASTTANNCGRCAHFGDYSLGCDKVRSDEVHTGCFVAKPAAKEVQP